MSARVESILALLRMKFSTLSLSANAGQNPRAIEQEIADAVFNSLQSYDQADAFELEQNDEVTECNYPQDEDFVPVYENFGVDREFFTFEYISKVIAYVDEHPTHTWKTLRTKFTRLKDRSYIKRFREYQSQMGTWRERLIQVAQHTKEQFDFARANLLAVHDDDLRKWALQKAREVELTRFSASHTWIQNFKRCYRMSSRKINKFTTHKREREQEEIENSALELIVDFMDTVRPHYDPPQIFNSDQSGFNYLVYSNRTLSNTGEKKTLVAVQTVNALTHSYTIQPTLNMDGHLVGRLLVNLQETGGQFGPIVSSEVTRYTNLFVTCSRSGKLDKGLMRTWCQTIFKEILDRTHTDKCVLYLDSWGGQRDPSLFQLDGKQINIKTFPPGTTSLIQPLDVHCFQMWKNFAKRMTRACAMIGHRIDRRDDALRLQSLIYNQFQHTDFRAMWLCGWRQAGFEVPAIPFPSIETMLFNVRDACSVANCLGIAFIRCVHCKTELCVECFFVKYHIH